MAKADQAGRRHRDERGSMAALEAVFIGMLLMSSIAILTSLAPDKPSVSPARSAFTNVAEDALRGMEAIPTGDRYMNELNKVVAKAYVGNTTDLDAFLGRALPPGAGYRLWLDNGHARKLLVGNPDRGPPRESVSATRLWHPDWAYAFLVPMMDVVPSDAALPLTGYAVSQGAMVKEAGVPLRATVTTSTGVYDASFAASVRDGPSASLYLLNATGSPAYTYQDPLNQTTVGTFNSTNSGAILGSFVVPPGMTNLTVTSDYTGALVSYTTTLTSPTGGTYINSVTCTTQCHARWNFPPLPGPWGISASGVASSALLQAGTYNVTTTRLATDWTVVVREEAGQPLPAGTNLTVTFPAPFTEGNLTSLVQPGWRNINASLAPDGGVRVTAELATPLSGATRSLVVHANRTAAATDALYLARAELGNGTSGRATFVIGGVSGVVTRASNPVEHRAYLAYAKPFAPSAPAQLAVVFSYPAYLNVTQVETVRSVDVWAPGNESVFSGSATTVPAAGTGSSVTSGWSVVSPSRLRWTGSAAVLPNDALAFVVRVNTTANRTSDEPPWKMPLAFDNGYASALRDRGPPNVFLGSVPPAAGGTANGFPVGALNVSVNASSAFYARSSLVSGNATYNVTVFPPLSAYAADFRTGLLASHLNLTADTARLGQPVTVHADFQGLLASYRAWFGAPPAWNLTVSVFDPAQPFVPRAQMLPTAQAWSATGEANLTFTPGEDDFYGPHAVLAEVRFLIPDAKSGQSIYETARLLSVLDVVPDGGQAETALYWVILEAWMPDWG